MTIFFSYRKKSATEASARSRTRPRQGTSSPSCGIASCGPLSGRGAGQDEPGERGGACKAADGIRETADVKPARNDRRRRRRDDFGIQDGAKEARELVV